MAIIKSLGWSKREKEERNSKIRLFYRSKQYSYRELGILFGLSATSISKICRIVPDKRV